MSPNFIYVGMGKSGTTWLFKILQNHPEIFVTDVKETNFFDLNYHRGIDWYLNFFQKSEVDVVGEISHRYIHVPGVAERISKDLGRIKIIVGLRKPVDYFLSDYLFTIRNGRFSGSIEDWAADGFDWKTLDYKSMLEPYIKEFGLENIYIYNFNELEDDPISFLKKITKFLNVSDFTIKDIDFDKVNQASRPRSKRVSLVVNVLSKYFKRRGGQRLISMVKKNKLIGRILFSELEKKPKISLDLDKKIHSFTKSNIRWMDVRFGSNFYSRWYSDCRKDLE